MTRKELQEWLRSDPDEFNDAMRQAMAGDTGTRWLHEHGMFVFSASSPAQFWARWMDMTMAGSAGKIRCPTLVSAGATDHLDPGTIQAHALYDRLTCDRELMVYSDEYGAGSHCQFGAFAQSFEGKFNWLDETMGITR